MFSWARTAPLEIPRRMPAEGRIYFVSDIHLGDGTRSDIFLGKDKALLALIEQIRAEGAHLVIAGDAIDFHQAWSISRVLRAHARLIGELSRLADQSGVTYIWGNHDSDMALFRDLMRFEVCSSLDIGGQILVQHGHQFDPFIGPNLGGTHFATLVLNLLERSCGSWIRLPLENFYTPPNRFAFWVSRFVDRATAAVEEMGRRRGEVWARGMRHTLWYWTQNQLGDPGCLFEPIRAFLPQSPYRYLVTGHSHLPGRVPIAEDRVYINTGSWTFHSSQYAVWDGQDITVRDWGTGRSYEDRAYLPVLQRRIQHMQHEDWWRENYLGWLRFRVGEEGRLPQLRSPRRALPLRAADLGAGGPPPGGRAPHGPPSPPAAPTPVNPDRA